MNELKFFSCTTFVVIVMLVQSLEMLGVVIS